MRVAGKLVQEQANDICKRQTEALGDSACTLLGDFIYADVEGGVGHGEKGKGGRYRKYIQIVYVCIRFVYNLYTKCN